MATPEELEFALAARVDEMAELIVAAGESEVASGIEIAQLIARRAGVNEALTIVRKVMAGA